MGLATTIATDYRNIPGVNLDDVIQQARVALVKSARFYPKMERAMPFKNYAGTAIRNELNTLYGRQGRISRNESVSLDETVTADGLSRQELIPDAAAESPLSIEREETESILSETLNRLPERPRAIVRGFMAGQSAEDMAPALGISRQMVNRILRGALAVMRQRLRERGFEGQEEGVLFAGQRARGSEDPSPGNERAGQEFSASTPSGQGADKKQVSNSGVLPYAYLDGNDSFQKAQDRFGGPQGLLRGAAQILGESARYDEGSNSPQSSHDEIRQLTRFAREAGLMMDAEKVRAYFANNPMRGGSEHKIAHNIGSEQVIKDLNAHAIATESLFGYLTDLELSNHFFGDGIRLEGFHEFDGKLHGITSQPFRRGIHPELHVLKDALEEQGLESESPTGSAGAFTIHDEKAGDISVIDIKEDNVIWDEAAGIAFKFAAIRCQNEKAARDTIPAIFFNSAPFFARNRAFGQNPLPICCQFFPVFRVFRCFSI